MRIHTYDVGPGHPVFIVAEGGSNHGGSLDAALALTDAAADAGANAMKWQLWDADKMYDPTQFPDEYASAVKWQMPREWLPTLRDRAHERGMAFGCSAFDFDSLDFVDGLVDFHKVASIEATWDEYRRAVADKGKPIFISTGMMSNSEFTDLLDWLRSAIPKERPWFKEWLVAILQCAVTYPCAIEDANLATLGSWTWESQGDLAYIWDFPFGLSDHTIHPTIAPCAAVALGACVIEKHLQLDSMAIHKLGFHVDEWQQALPDFRASIYPFMFKEMVTAIRLTEQALGSADKRIRESERPYLRYRRGPRGLRGA